MWLRFATRGFQSRLLNKDLLFDAIVSLRGMMRVVVFLSKKKDADKKLDSGKVTESCVRPQVYLEFVPDT